MFLSYMCTKFNSIISKVLNDTNLHCRSRETNIQTIRAYGIGKLMYYVSNSRWKELGSY